MASDCQTLDNCHAGRWTPLPWEQNNAPSWNSATWYNRSYQLETRCVSSFFLPT